VTDPNSLAYNLIAYAARNGTSYDLVVVGAEGGRRSVLLPSTWVSDPVNGCEYVYPDWSRDAANLVALSRCHAGTSYVWAIIIVPLERPLDNYAIFDPGGYTLPRWARQRDALVFHTSGGSFTLELQADASGIYSASGPATRVNADFTYPAWSADDSMLVGTGVYKYDFASTVTTFLYNGAEPDWRR